MRGTSRRRKIATGNALWAGLVIPLFAAAAEQAHYEEVVEEVVVTAPFLQSAAETALPVGILSDEALQEKIANSLGATLKNEIGIANESFGAGVGRPVIRGMSANRVSVLRNGVGLTDVSNVSPDHANAVEPVLAQRLEILRGPAVLLYGSGAIGGVVNVIDNSIPEMLVDETRFMIDQSHNTVNDENKTVVKLDGSSGAVGFHLDAFRRRNENVEVRGFAIDEASVEALEELAEDDHGDEEDEHEEEEFDNTRGYIGNSDGRAEGATFGLSRVGDNGFLGFSISSLDNEYGLPPGVHGHGHEEEHGDEEEEHEEEEEEDVQVRLELEQVRYDLKGRYDFTSGWFDHVQASVGYTDYEHREIEIEEDGHELVGTVYRNRGLEGRIGFNHEQDANHQGIWGLQFGATEFAATGEEAFIPESDVGSLGLFGVERFTRDRLTTEFGVRFERNSIDPGGRCDFEETSTSLSASLLYDFDEASNVLAAVSRSQRAATVEELFSNVSNSSCARFADDEQLVLHAATALLEIGNPSLDQETSSNFELGLRRHSGAITGEISAYYNQIDDYIFIDVTGEEIEEQPVALYSARDATFTGVEAEITFNLARTGPGNLALGLYGDVVNAEFDSGGDVPRIPPAKVGAELRWFGDRWSVHLHLTRVLEQRDTGVLELPTDGYTLLSLSSDYHWTLGNAGELTAYLRGDNLLDEEIRNHVSFLKHYAPEPGRGIRLGLRWNY